MSDGVDMETIHLSVRQLLPFDLHSPAESEIRNCLSSIRGKMILVEHFSFFQKSQVPRRFLRRDSVGS